MAAGEKGRRGEEDRTFVRKGAFQIGVLRLWRRSAVIGCGFLRGYYRKDCGKRREGGDIDPKRHLLERCATQRIFGVVE